MLHLLFALLENIFEFIFQFFDPTVIAALIAALVALVSVSYNFRTLKLQRIEGERQEVYKKLNSFYGPMRLHLKTSNELYKLFKKSVQKKLNKPKKFRTLPYILQGKKFSKTEKELLTQIIKIGRKMESIINQNAGLIDDDDLHKEMIALKTHIIIIRSAYENRFEAGKDIEQLLHKKTFPNDMVKNVDRVFWELKIRLDELNKKKKVSNPAKQQKEKNTKTNNPPSQESHAGRRPEDSQHHLRNGE